MFRTRQFRALGHLLALAPLLSTAALASNALPTSTNLSIGSASVSPGQAITLSASVTDSSGAVLTGQIAFCDGSVRSVCTAASANLLGFAQITPSGTAAMKVRLGVGSHNILARFVGTTVDVTSLSNAASVNVAAPSSVPTLTDVTNIIDTYAGLVQRITADVYSPFVSAAPTGTLSYQVATANTSTTLATDTLKAVTNSSASSLAFGRFSGSESGPSVANNFAVGDFNEDGIPDLLVSVATQTPSPYSVYLGSGDGTFRTTVAKALPSGFCSASSSNNNIATDSRVLAVADFNADGHEDIVAICGGLIFAYGKGDGSFSPGLPIAVTNASQVLVGDFNGDGRLDLFVLGSRGTNSYNLLLQQADHSFQVLSSTLPGAVSYGLTYGSGLLAADVNGDGISDLIDGGTDGQGSFQIYKSNGDGTFTTSSSVVSAASGQPLGLTLGDFNGDGVADLAASAIQYSSSLVGAVLLNNGSGSFVPQPSFQYYVQTGATVGAPTWFDANGDGLTDVVATGATYYVGSGSCNSSDYAGLSKGDGTLTFTRVSEGYGGVYCSQLSSNAPGVVADLNGDGHPDLVFSGYPILNQTGWGVSSDYNLYSTVPVPGNTLPLTVSYASSGNFLSGSSGTTFVYGEGSLSTSLSLSASPQSGAAGQPITLTAALAPHSSGPASTDGESISFTINGQTYPGTLSAGVASVQVSGLAAGSYSAAASYAGDDVFNSSVAAPVTVAVASSAPGNLGLSGAYVFRFSGSLPAASGPISGFAATGWFQADGAGNIAAGKEDLNSGVASATASALTGNFALAADGTGTLHLVNAQGLVQDFAVVLAQKTSGVAQRLTLIGLGNQGSVLSGSAVLQATNPSSLALSGTYTLALNGETACSGTSCSNHGPGQVALLGSVTATATASGQTASGQLLENAGGTIALDSSSALALSPPDSNGRVTATLSSTIDYIDQPQHYVGYYVNANQLYLLATDPHTTNILLSGSLNQQ